jgi:ankyrin repeat protein
MEKVIGKKIKSAIIGSLLLGAFSNVNFGFGHEFGSFDYDEDGNPGYSYSELHGAVYSMQYEPMYSSVAMDLKEHLRDILGRIQKLLDKGANVNEQDSKGETPLHLSAKKGFVEITHALLSVKGIDINVKNKNDKTPLDLAANEQIRILLQNSNSPPLHMAVLINDLSKVQELLKNNDINKQDGRGETPLHLAVKKEFVEIVKELLKRNADVNVKNNNGKTPLDLATNLKIKGLFKFANVRNKFREKFGTLTPSKENFKKFGDKIREMKNKVKDAFVSIRKKIFNT